jgi:hypothetical protein
VGAVIVAKGKSTTAGINVGNLINGDDINGDATMSMATISIYKMTKMVPNDLP